MHSSLLSFSLRYHKPFHSKINQKQFILQNRDYLLSPRPFHQKIAGDENIRKRFFSTNWLFSIHYLFPYFVFADPLQGLGSIAKDTMSQKFNFFQTEKLDGVQTKEPLFGLQVCLPSSF